DKNKGKFYFSRRFSSVIEALREKRACEGWLKNFSNMITSYSSLPLWNRVAAWRSPSFMPTVFFPDLLHQALL
ncbi:hypothetical protein, partial [Mailhella massiliensis]|uniref:hypothetical protein n=1 Tax=Mailhella massiliensis TaxID=1903261 RepID=UPI0023F58EDF